jgi:hypothetical protein
MASRNRKIKKQNSSSLSSESSDDSPPPPKQQQQQLLNKPLPVNPIIWKHRKNKY